MITRVRIQNFRCLRDVELHLTPLTVLVGPNASGNSSGQALPVVAALQQDLLTAVQATRPGR